MIALSAFTFLGNKFTYEWNVLKMNMQRIYRLCSWNNVTLPVPHCNRCLGCRECEVEQRDVDSLAGVDADDPGAGLGPKPALRRDEGAPGNRSVPVTFTCLLV